MLNENKFINLNIGDIVEIDAPNFYIQGKFAVKDITYSYYKEYLEEYRKKFDYNNNL